jgi:RNA exonuclease 1
VPGEKVRIYSCCSRPTREAEGCVLGPHVFYETDPAEVHSRHPFSRTASTETAKDTALDVVAIDCEMIYTTAGMSVARVSVVDGAGKEVFDEFVRMSEGVEIM